MIIHVTKNNDTVTAVSTVPIDGSGEYKLMDPFLYPEKLEGYILYGNEMYFSQEKFDAVHAEKKKKEEMEQAKEILTDLTQTLVLDTVSDEIALTMAPLYPEYEIGVEYLSGKRINVDGILYRVLLDHVSQADWKPENSPSLYAKVLIPTADVTPEWEQPNSTNTYMKGDRVTHFGKTWESQIDNNAHEPGIEGVDERIWKEVVE